jgi:hypothetical protein
MYIVFYFVMEKKITRYTKRKHKRPNADKQITKKIAVGPFNQNKILRKKTRRYTKRIHRKPREVNVNRQKTKKIMFGPFDTPKPKPPNKMNCNPIVEDKTISDETCYTPDILLRIRDEYNKNHSRKEQIKTKKPKKVWEILKKRLHTCEKEDCWLKEIKDDTLRKQIDEYIFAPDSPPEWKQNPNEWLSNFDILNVLNQYEKKYKNFDFLGPAPIDFDKKIRGYQGDCVTFELCKFSLKNHVDKNVNKIGIIYNTDKHNQGGSHWISMFIDLEEKFIYYFDSVGHDIPSEISIFKDRVIKEATTLTPPLQLDFYKNYPTSHQQSNTECGMYSLFFIITMLTGKTEFSNNMSMKEKIELFSNEKIPDKYVEHYRKVYFND